MNKRHHPHSRAERLALKELSEKPQDKPSKIRRKLIQSLKDEETANELREVAQR